MKNKLIELLKESSFSTADYCSRTGCKDCIGNYENGGGCFRELEANYLIANGVTIQKWIPVEERFPTEEDAGEHRTVIVREVSGEVRTVYFSFVRLYQYEFTHWMSLPEVHKEDWLCD